jgi:hypothetical protein
MGEGAEECRAREINATAVVNSLALIRRKFYTTGTGNNAMVASELKLHVLNLLTGCKSEFSIDLSADIQL